MDVDEIQYETLACAELGRRRLREKQRGFKIAADQIVPGRVRNLSDRRRVEGRGIVDENIERTECSGGCRENVGVLIDVEEVRRHRDRAVDADAVKTCRQRVSRFTRRPIMNDDAGAGRMQRRCNGRAHAPCGTGDQGGA